MCLRCFAYCFIATINSIFNILITQSHVDKVRHRDRGLTVADIVVGRKLTDWRIQTQSIKHCAYTNVTQLQTISKTYTTNWYRQNITESIWLKNKQAALFLPDNYNKNALARCFPAHSAKTLLSTQITLYEANKLLVGWCKVFNVHKLTFKGRTIHNKMLLLPHTLSIVGVQILICLPTKLANWLTSGDVTFNYVYWAFLNLNLFIFSYLNNIFIAPVVTTTSIILSFNKTG